MEKMRLISHAREIETLFNEYLEVIYGARQDTFRIISSLEAIVLNIDLLAAASASSSPGEAKEEPMAAHARTLALVALSAANNTATRIEGNIPKAQEGAAKTAGLMMRLTRGQLAADESYDSLYLALAEIKKAARQVEKDAERCVAVARALLPQVENLQNRMLVLLPLLQKGNGQKAKKIVAGRKPGVSLPIVQKIH